MKRLNLLLLSLGLLLITAVLAGAAEPGEKAVDLGARQVKMEGLSLINAFFAGWYNSNKYVFVVIVTVVMGVIGALIAFVTDLFLKAVGMDVSKIEHHE